VSSVSSTFTTWMPNSAAPEPMKRGRRVPLPAERAAAGVMAMLGDGGATGVRRVGAAGAARTGACGPRRSLSSEA